MGTVTRADWSGVTLAEFAALNILKRTDALDLMNQWWLETHIANPLRNEEPTRLTPEGEQWLAELQERVRTTWDEHDEIAGARDFVRRMGTLMVMGIDRELRRRGERR